MLRVGLTGGVASGKSTLAGLLAARGAAVRDADAIVAELYAAGREGAHAVVGLFGPGVLAPDGGVDRAVLGELALTDARRRESLERAVHPLVRREVDRWLRELQQSPAPPRVAVVEAALLVGTGAYRDYDRLVVVSAAEALRRQRALASGWSTAMFERVVRAQASEEAREAVADYVIRNDGEPQALERAADALWAMLLEDAEAKTRGAALARRSAK